MTSIKQDQIQDQIQGYAAKIMEEIATNWLPGLGMSAMALELNETETDQLSVDMLQELKSRITELQCEIVQEARDEGFPLRLP